MRLITQSALVKTIKYKEEKQIHMSITFFELKKERELNANNGPAWQKLALYNISIFRNYITDLKRIYLEFLAMR